MWKMLVILALVATAVLADNYMCPDAGAEFQCYESSPESRFCLTDGKESKVVCTKCKRKYEFCKNAMITSKNPDRSCGSKWEATPCTTDNSFVPDIM